MLNYSVPQFQFLIGVFDASEYLDSISLSVPMHEQGQPLLWAGRFRVSNNLRARANGLSDASFSEFDNPGVWRPFQRVVRLIIRGYGSPVFRIDNYRYDVATRVGEGTLTQIPMAVAGDRPGVEVETTVSGSIKSAIEGLLTAAFVGATVSPGRSLAGDSGVLDVPLVTRNPWADAVRLSGLSWHWLGIDASESIVSIDGAGGGLVLNRSLVEVELVPDLAAIYQSAGKVIVTGARQIEDASALSTSAPLSGQSAKVPRPKFKTTTEERPLNTIFPAEAATTITVFEQKTIVYQYWDDAGFNDLPNILALTNFLYDIQTRTQTGINPFVRPPDLNLALQTITMKLQPMGYLFPSLGSVTTLVVAEVIVESSLRKLVLKPRGVLFPTETNNLTLGVEKRETLTSAAIPPGAQLTPVKKDLNGEVQKYEARSKLEDPQPVATRPLKTEVLRGEARLLPLGWIPVLAKPLVVDFGFLPDKARADFLARRIAVREQRRRDQVLVDMPIPDEWLGSGWPLLKWCAISGSIYLMDGCAISIADGEAKFGFTGALVSRGVSVDVGGVPMVLQQPQYQVLVDIEGSIEFELEVVSTDTAVGLEPAMVFELEVSGGVQVDVGVEMVFEADVVSRVVQVVGIVVDVVSTVEGD